jgi:hypothetical protein
MRLHITKRRLKGIHFEGACLLPGWPIRTALRCAGFHEYDTRAEPYLRHIETITGISRQGICAYWQNHQRKHGDSLKSAWTFFKKVGLARDCSRHQKVAIRKGVKRG